MIISDSLYSVSVNRAAELLEVSRSGFYKWFQRSIRPEGDPNLDIQIREEIQNIAIEFPGYGYRRVTIELQNRSYSVKEKIVRKCMKEDNLLCVKREKEVQITDHRLKSWRKNISESGQGFESHWYQPSLGCRHNLHPVVERVRFSGSYH